MPRDPTTASASQALEALYPLSTERARAELLGMYSGTGKVTHLWFAFEGLAERWPGGMDHFVDPTPNADWRIHWRRFFGIAQGDAAWLMFSPASRRIISCAADHLAADFHKIAGKTVQRWEAEVESPMRACFAALAEVPEWPLNWLRFGYLLGAAACEGYLDESYAKQALNNVGLLYSRWRFAQPPNPRLSRVLTGQGRVSEELAPALVGMFLLLQPRVEWRSNVRVPIAALDRTAQVDALDCAAE